MTFDTEEGSGRRLRKRKVQQQHSVDDSEAALEQLLEVAANAQKIVVFSGSGLSASSGMSTFSTRGGLYERAQKKFKLADGKMLFTYAFFDRQRPEAQAFFADIYSEAVLAEPAAGHHALRHLFDAGRLHRHYTMNIDGLAGQVGMDTWHHEHNTGGVTVEMHGNVHYLVCPECHATAPMDAALAKKIRAKQIVPCTAPDCGEGSMRFKVMMYDDGEAECITPDDVMELMEADVKAADLVLWVGISFQQSASTLYFRKVRCWIQEAGRLDTAVQALVNPSDESLFNLRTAMSNQSELRVLEVLAESDEALPLLADRLRILGGGGGGGGAMGVGASPVLAAANRARAAAAAAAAHRAKKEQQEQAAGAAGVALAATHVHHPKALVGAPPLVAFPGAAMKQESFNLPLALQQQQLQQQQHSHQVLGLPPLRAQLHTPVPQMSTPEALLKAVGFPGIPLQAAAPGSFPSQPQPGQQLPAILQLSQQQQQATIHTLELLQAALQAALQVQLGGAGQAQAPQQQQYQQHQQGQQQYQQQQQGQQSQHYNQQQEHHQLNHHQQQHQSVFPAHQGASLAQLLGGLQSAAAAAAAAGGQRSGVSPSPPLHHAQQQQQQQAWALQAASVVAAAGGAACVKREQSPQGVVLQEQLSHESEQYDQQQQAGQR